MKQILGAALLPAEIMASVSAVDLAFSLIDDPSTVLVIAGIWLLFLVGAFWYYRLLVAKHRREERQKKGGDDAGETNEGSTLGKLEQFVSRVGGDAGRRVRDAHGPGKRGIQVDRAGSQRGVEDLPIRAGGAVYNPAASKVVQYPTLCPDRQRDPRPE